MAIPIRYITQQQRNQIRNAPGTHYIRGPEVREPYIPPYPPVTPTPTPPTPTPPTPSYTISGTVSESGTGFSVPLAISGVGTLYSAASGSYGFAVTSGYSGLVIPIWFGGTFSPDSRAYVAVVADQTGQDYIFTGTTPAPPTPPIVLTGEVRLEGIPYDSATVGFSGSGSVVTDSFGTYVGTVSYGYSGTSALTGFNPPVYTVTPSGYVYSSLTTDQAGQDFDIDINFLVISGTVTENGTGIPVSYTNGFGTFATAASGSYGYYVPYGWSGSTIPLSGSGTFSPDSYVYGPVGVDHLNDNFAFYANPAPTPSYLITGDVTENGTGMSVPIVFDTLGTFQSAVSGSYGLNALAGYSGTATPVWFGGSFTPQSRVYSNLSGDQLAQDYAFTGTSTPPVPTDCPIPGANVNIPLPVGNDASRNVIDPVNNLLWVIDENGPDVYYVDVVAGTYAGSVVTNATYGSPCIAYDSANQKIVVSTYDGSLAFINPATKAVTYSNFTQRWPGYHLLAVSDAGTAFVADYRTSSGWLYVVDCATEQLISQHSFTSGTIFTDSICFAENIGKLVLNQSQPFNTRFNLFDPATGSFARSVLNSGAWSFNYENYYVRATGHVLMSRNGAAAIDVIDIINGTNATIIDSLTGVGTRLSDATEDTCSNRLFFSDGNYAAYEYTLDGSYTLLKIFDDWQNGINPTGLAHSRASNLVYYEQWNGSPIPVRSIQATRNGTNLVDAAWVYDPTQAGNGTGAALLVNGTGTFWSTAYGDGTTSFQSYMPWWDAYVTNLGTAYPAKIRVEYSGSQYHTGALGVSNTDYVELTINNDNNSFATYSDGSFGGIVEVNGTIAYGWNTLNINIQNYTGQAVAPPAYMFATMNGNISVTPLVP